MRQNVGEMTSKAVPEKGLTPLERKHLEETKQRHHTALQQLSRL
ncbi:MAG: hypothetical protein WCX22_10765 [Methanoregula sp.]